MKQPLALGEIYIDCFNHPTVCTEVTPNFSYTLTGLLWERVWYLISGRAPDWNLAGVSMEDGSFPRSCSAKNCAPPIPDPTGYSIPGVVKDSSQSAIIAKDYWVVFDEKGKILDFFRKRKILPGYVVKNYNKKFAVKSVGQAAMLIYYAKSRVWMV